MRFPIMLTCPKGLENLLVAELEKLGLKDLKNHPSSVLAEASLSEIYQIALWSRLANRLHLILGTGDAKNRDDLYLSAKNVKWSEVFSSVHSFKVMFHGHSSELRNEMYAAMVVKDAIVDSYRDLGQARPNVATAQADIVIHAFLKHQQVTFTLDLIGYSMHQRGYRIDQGQAPLKENVAAALLYRMHWPERLATDQAFADFMCGSGTLVIEAAMMAANLAPGLLRDDQHFGFWLQHQPALWEQARNHAVTMQRTPKQSFYGADKDLKVLKLAQANAKRAGVDASVTWEHQDLTNLAEHPGNGLVIINPPYGERMGEQAELLPLYQQIGQCLHHNFKAWTAAVITSDPMLAKAIGLRSHKQYHIHNGPIACQLYAFNLDDSNLLKPNKVEALQGNALMLANRLSKNMKHLKKWALHQHLECYRIYDADLPEYAFAIDKYQDYYVIQEYMPPKQIPSHVAMNRRLDMMRVLPQVFGLPEHHFIFKERKPQKEQQYQKLDSRQSRLKVSEGQAHFFVNLYDYLDTGLFLDHRLLRLGFAKLKPGTRFLNLFCYTATASVHAGLAGASTLNVDLSRTYLTWATENFKLNRLPERQHRFVQADVLSWLTQNEEKFDVIFMDAPSFSNSKRMEGTLDIQRDHCELINQAYRHLMPGGCLYFSTHLRSFRLDQSLASRMNIINISSKTFDLDFKRDPKLHQCYLIQKK